MFTKLPREAFLLSIPLLILLIICSGCQNQQGVEIGRTAPGISGNDLHGEYVTLSMLKGKVVVIYFWTNSCCGGSLKELEPVYRRQRYNGLEILAINELNAEKEVQSYVKNNALTFTVLTDERSMLSRQYGVFGFPTILILDREGMVREKILGPIQAGKLEKLTLGYLKQNPKQK
jgi:peroxiredoxin